jgi:CBS domain-containing protein
MKCKDIMTKYVKMCNPESTAKEAAQIMKAVNAGVVPVVDKTHKILGILTDRDIALNTVAEGKNPNDVQVQDFMQTSVITAHPNDDIDIAIKKMKQYQIRRIPIIDDASKLVGIISLGDVAVLSHKEHETFESLEKISEPVSMSK